MNLKLNFIKTELMHRARTACMTGCMYVWCVQAYLSLGSALVSATQRLATGALWPVRTHATLPFATSHTRTLLSSPPDHKHGPMTAKG